MHSTQNSSSSSKHHSKDKRGQERSYEIIIDSLNRGTSAEKRAFGAVIGTLVGDSIGFFLYGHQVDDKMVLDAMKMDQESGETIIKLHNT